MEVRKMGRPRQGEDVKEVFAVRLERAFYTWLIKKHGSLALVFDKDHKTFEREKRKLQKEFKKLRELRGKPPKE